MDLELAIRSSAKQLEGDQDGWNALEVLPGA